MTYILRALLVFLLSAISLKSEANFELDCGHPVRGESKSSYAYKVKFEAIGKIALLEFRESQLIKQYELRPIYGIKHITQFVSAEADVSILQNPSGYFLSGDSGHSECR